MEVKTLVSNIQEYDVDLHDVIGSTCKILLDDSQGSGFLIQLPREGDSPLFCLMTCEHVISKDLIDSKAKIKVNYGLRFNVEITLNRDERYIQDFRYKNIDATVVQILEKDKIKENYFLLPNLDYKFYGYNKFINNEIYITQFPGEESKGKLSSSKGIIKSIDCYTFSHKASTEKGSSGSPIFIKGTITVIGIHTSGNEGEHTNYGNFIGPVIESVEKKYVYDKKKYDNGTYEGEYREKKGEGYGKFVWGDDHYYAGYWLDDKQHGRGFFKNGNIVFEGEFSVGKPKDGTVYYIIDDKLYKGQLLDGKPHGEATLYYKNGLKINYTSN